MAERECPGCALTSSEEEEACPYCGYEFPPERRSRQYAVWLMILLLLLWLLF